MKKLSFLIILAVATASFSFNSAKVTSEYSVNNDIQFKVINDTGAPFDYYVNSQHLTIAASRSEGFSYAENTVVYKWTNGAQGDAWFTVKPEMQGHSFQLSQLLTSQN